MPSRQAKQLPRNPKKASQKSVPKSLDTPSLTHRSFTLGEWRSTDVQTRLGASFFEKIAICARTNYLSSRMCRRQTQTIRVRRVRAVKHTRAPSALSSSVIFFLVKYARTHRCTCHRPYTGTYRVQSYVRRSIILFENMLFY